MLKVLLMEINRTSFVRMGGSESGWLEHLQLDGLEKSSIDLFQHKNGSPVSVTLIQTLWQNNKKISPNKPLFLL